MKIRYLKEDNNQINDDYIKSLYFTKQETINSNYLKSTWLERHPEINDYLVNRYPDSTSYKETLYRILLGIEERPVCKTCGKPVNFEASHRWHRNRNGWPFMRYCSAKCQANDPEIKDKHIQTYLDKYGVDNPAKNKEVKEKIRQTNLDKYGVENVYQSKVIQDRIKKTNLERYGVEHVFQSPDFIERSHNTNLQKYGAKTYAESNIAKSKQNIFIQKYKDTCLRKYGVDCYAKTQEYRDYIKAHREEISQKQYNTKKKNNSFNVSSKEEYLYNLLAKHYDNIIRQYKSNEYPFACDFYIPKLNLYIEYQGNWTHGPHPYIEEIDADAIEYIKKKSENSAFYKNAFIVWTKADVRKRNDAIENNLNYLEIYPYIDLNDIPDIIKDNYSENTIGNHLIVGTK